MLRVFKADRLLNQQEVSYQLKLWVDLCFFSLKLSKCTEHGGSLRKKKQKRSGLKTVVFSFTKSLYRGSIVKRKSI